MCDGSGTFVGRDYRLVTCDLRTSIYCSYLGTRWRMFENIGSRHGLASRTAGATSGCMQSGNSSWSLSGRNRGAVGNRGAAAEADAIGEQLAKNRGAAAGADTNGEQQLKQIDAIREQQLKRTELGSSSSAQRAVRHRITHVGERGGSSWCS